VKVPGDLLSDRYRIVKTLGQGGMGTVYLAAVEALDDKAVAVKELVLTSDHEHHDIAVELFRKEASLLAHLNHPNLVPVTDFFVDEGAAYLVMAFVEGEDLGRRLVHEPEHKLSVDEVLEIFEELCEVLIYLHRQNPPILFRDLKPSNIMYDKSNSLKLIDFGIARRRSEGETTAFLKGVGTAGFAAIEQHSETSSTDQRTDIYALGATLYNLLTGQVPPDAVARSAGYTSILSVLDLRPEVGPELNRVIMKCLELRPERRYQTVRQLQREFFEPLPPLDGPTELLKKPVLGETKKQPEKPVADSSPKTGSNGDFRTVLLTLLLAVSCFMGLTLLDDDGPSAEVLDLRREISTPHSTLDPESDRYGLTAASFSGLTYLKSSGLDISLPQKADLESYFDIDDSGPDHLIAGVTDFLEDEGFKEAEFDVEGWNGRAEFPEQQHFPSEALLEDALDNPTAIWLQVGFYKDEGEYLRRVSSRWMNVVGYLDDKLTLFDTRPTQSRALSLRVEEVSPSQTLVGDAPGLPVIGSRQVELLGDMSKPDGTERAIIDCMVVLWMDDVQVKQSAKPQ
jgi:serine/threonine protein kinase